VVDTGMPHLLAKTTKKPVTTLATSPCPWFIPVISLLMVCATFFAFSIPPMAIQIAIAVKLQGMENKLAAIINPAILGVSLRPLEKQTTPELK